MVVGIRALLRCSVEYNVRSLGVEVPRIVIMELLEIAYLATAGVWIVNKSQAVVVDLVALAAQGH